MTTKRNPKPHTKKHWRAGELDLSWQLRMTGLSTAEVAMHLGRTAPALRSAWQKAGYSLRQASKSIDLNLPDGVCPLCKR